MPKISGRLLLMSDRIKNFASEVLRAFRAAGHVTSEEIASAGGPSTTTVSKLRKAARTGELPTPRGDVMHRIDIAAEWPDGTAIVLWDTGGLPNAEILHSIGSGGIPVGELDSRRMETRVGSDADGNVTVTAISSGNAGHAVSVLEVIYRPGVGNDVLPTDLMTVALRAHHAAVRATYRTGTRRPGDTLSDPSSDAETTASYISTGHPGDDSASEQGAPHSSDDFPTTTDGIDSSDSTARSPGSGHDPEGETSRAADEAHELTVKRTKGRAAAADTNAKEARAKEGDRRSANSKR